MALNTPKRIRTLASLASSPPHSEYGSPPWHTTNSPTSACGSPEFVVNQQVCEKNENRRGKKKTKTQISIEKKFKIYETVKKKEILKCKIRRQKLL